MPLPKLPLILALLIAALGGADYATAAALPTIKGYLPNEMIVKYKPAFVAKGTYRAGMSAKGAKLVSTLSNDGLMRVQVAAGQSVEDAVRSFAGAEGVEFAQPNYVYRKMAVPNDTQYGQQWFLKNTGQTVSGDYTNPQAVVAGADIGAETAWNTITDCSSVTVAVVDSGVNYNQQDLASNMWNGGSAYPNHGYDFVQNDNDPMDLDGHGTHVAGIIGARGNDGVGTTGVCWRASIMAVRVLDTAGSGTTAGVVNGINFAVNQGAKVINLSLGQPTYDAAMATAINNASNAGVVVVAAAGNDTSNNETTSIYPCNFTSANLLCVAALDQTNTLATFSNWGSTHVHVGAYGANILSTVQGSYTKQTDPNYTGWTSTSPTWGVSTFVAAGPTNYPALANPATWNGGSAKYANSLDARTYKSFNLAGADAAILELYASYATQPSADLFQVGYLAGTGDPFASGTIVSSVSGTTNGDAVYRSYDMSACRTNPCTVGFRLTTNASVVDTGVALVGFSLNSLTLNTNSYDELSGTSMATPVVAGIAAMLRAYNPSYTAADTVASIKNGGVANSSLTGKTTTGKVASASGSLLWIAAPVGVTATVN